MEKIKDTKNTCDPLIYWSFRNTLLGKAKSDNLCEFCDLACTVVQDQQYVWEDGSG